MPRDPLQTLHPACFDEKIKPHRFTLTRHRQIWRDFYRSRMTIAIVFTHGRQVQCVERGLNRLSTHPSSGDGRYYPPQVLEALSDHAPFETVLSGLDLSRRR